jgi:integrase
MRLFRIRRSPFWQYDFAVDGARFRGSTRAADRKAAQAAAERIRRETIEQNAAPKSAASDGLRHFTISQATARYWTEHAEDLPSARVIWGKLTLFNDLIGGAKRLCDLTGDDLLTYVARRRALVSDSTVNRDLTMLRAILNHARDRWGAAVAQLPWAAHRSIEPAGRTRSLSAPEFAALLEKLPEDFRDLVSFCAITGMRETAAISLTWPQIDFAGKQIHFRLKSKRPGGVPHVVPITKQLDAILRRQLGRHDTRVWCYRSGRARRGVKVGDWLPFSVSGGWAHKWRQAVKDAGLQDLRFHDLRHTAATRTLRATGNLVAANRLLGHLSAQSTMRYAHVNTDDLAAAMERAAAQLDQELGAQMAHKPRRAG